jgi:hypothetical protein
LMADIYQMDDLKKVCSDKIKEPRFQFKEDSLMAAFLISEKLEDVELKEKCLKMVMRWDLIILHY